MNIIINDLMSLHPMLVVFLTGIFLHLIYSLINRRKGVSSNQAEMALSLGILGTFIGIVSGLLDFNVSDIQGSIPPLLQGLKFAFLTSIAGMISSILIKSFAVRDKASGSEATPETIQSELSRINDTLEKNNDELKNEFKKLISGDNDTSLVNQIRLLKAELVEQLKENKDLNKSGFEELNNQFTQLGDKIAKLSSEAMVEALKLAIVEFNKQLADQLGDNFKQLNEGVKNLLAWQDEYKDIIKEMENSIKVTIVQLKDATDAISKISSSLEPIPKVVESIDKLFNDADKSIGLLSTTLESFKDMSDKAKNAFPLIEENITNMTNNFSEKIINVGNEINEISKTFSESITNNSKKINDTLSNSYEKIDSNLENAGQKSENLINETIAGLDKKMQDEITAAIEGLGSALASLSRKFADDYEPLTARLSELLRMSEKVKNRDDR